MDQIESMWRTYEAVSDWISIADSKAATMLGAEGVIIGFMATRSSNEIFLPWVYTGLYTLFAVSAALTVYLCIRSLAPTLRVGEPSSLIYFGHIVKCEGGAPSYTDKACAMWADPQESARELCNQVWANSCVADRKYRWVSRAIWSFGVSTVIAILIALF